MGMIGLPARKHTARINLTAPIGVKHTSTNTAPAGEWTMHEIVENAFLELKNYKLPGNIPITEYVDVSLVNSENPATLPGTPVTTYSLVVADAGTYAALGAVQAQYPDSEIKRLFSEGANTTYITTGTVLPSAYQAKGTSAIKGCDACPAGYTEVAQGFVYEIANEDLTDITVAIQALPGATALSAVLNDTTGDTKTYTVITDDELTEAEIATFIGANAAASITLIAKDVADLCTSAAPAAVAWVAGEACNYTTQAYTITLADNECGDSRLAELQNAFPDLVVTEVSDANCQRVYSTTVNTNLVCEECSEIFRDVFEAEAPGVYDNVSWTKAPKVYSGTAKLGIRVKGKRAILSGGEFFRDNMPFIDDSVEISLVGGFQTYTNESYLAGTNDRFTVKFFSRKSEAHNLGGNLRKYEEEAQIHFRGRGRYVGNNYGKAVNGQETRLEGLDSYIVYSVTIAPSKYVSNFQQAQNGAFTYHFPVALGKQAGIESILNKLAIAVGLPQVQAVSK